MKAVREQKQPSTAEQVDTEDQELFTRLWTEIQEEAGFGAEQIEEERLRYAEELAMLEARIQEKREQIDGIQARVVAAQEQLRALIRARLSPEAVLSAMRVEYRLRKSSGARAPKGKAEAAVNDNDKEMVLNHLDAEGLTAAEIRKQTGQSLSVVNAVLKALVLEERIEKSADGKVARYHLA